MCDITSELSRVDFDFGFVIRSKSELPMPARPEVAPVSKKLLEGSNITAPVLIALVATLIVALLAMAILKAIPRRWLI